MGVGLGILRGLALTLRHLVASYVVPRRPQPSLAAGVGPPEVRLPADMPTSLGGIITVQYPDEKLPVPEAFRYLPFLVFEEDLDSERAAFDGIRCTACGMCARVCPPQCIWIVQLRGADGKPRPAPKRFVIDASICMSCGLCAEFCPFDAIKMDHNYELSTYERRRSWVLKLDELLRPVAYHAAIHPDGHRREVAARQAKTAGQKERPPRPDASAVPSSAMAEPTVGEAASTSPTGAG